MLSWHTEFCFRLIRLRNILYCQHLLRNYIRIVRLSVCSKHFVTKALKCLSEIVHIYVCFKFYCDFCMTVFPFVLSYYIQLVYTFITCSYHFIPNCNFKIVDIWYKNNGIFYKKSSFFQYSTDKKIMIHYEMSVYTLGGKKQKSRCQTTLN